MKMIQSKNILFITLCILKIFKLLLSVTKGPDEDIPNQRFQTIRFSPSIEWNWLKELTRNFLNWKLTHLLRTVQFFFQNKYLGREDDEHWHGQIDKTAESVKVDRTNLASL